MIFENKGKENTSETLHIALNAAKERGTTLVVASNAGDTLIELIKMQEALGTNVPMVMVGQASLSLKLSRYFSRISNSVKPKVG